MSRRNRLRGRLSAKRQDMATKDPLRKVVQDQKNADRQVELEFYALLRAAQEIANREQSAQVVHVAGGPTVTVHPVPQHHAGERV